MGYGEDLVNQANFHIINERLNELEHKVFKQVKKAPTTRSQQMLLLHHLGMLDPILKLDLPLMKKAQLLSLLLNSSQDNIKKDLSIINKTVSSLKSKENFEFLHKLFEELGLEKKAKEIDLELNVIANRKEKR